MRSMTRSAHQLLEVARLGGREVVVDDDERRRRAPFASGADLLGLAGADRRSWRRAWRAFCTMRSSTLDARGVREARELLEGLVVARRVAREVRARGGRRCSRPRTDRRAARVSSFIGGLRRRRAGPAASAGARRRSRPRGRRGGTRWHAPAASSSRCGKSRRKCVPRLSSRSSADVGDAPGDGEHVEQASAARRCPGPRGARSPPSRRTAATAPVRAPPWRSMPTMRQSRARSEARRSSSSRMPVGGRAACPSPRRCTARGRRPRPRPAPREARAVARGRGPRAASSTRGGSPRGGPLAETSPAANRPGTLVRPVERRRARRRSCSARRGGRGCGRARGRGRGRGTRRRCPGSACACAGPGASGRGRRPATSSLRELAQDRARDDVARRELAARVGTRARSAGPGRRRGGRPRRGRPRR